MKEKLIIENFAGIDHLEIELNKINILIGPQASGKSITTKLFFYFKSFINEISKGIENGETKRDIDRNQTIKFRSYFPKESWSKDKFAIEYSQNNTWMKIFKDENEPILFEYSDNIKSIISRAKVLYKKEYDKINLNKNASHSKIFFGYKNEFDRFIKKEYSDLLSTPQYFIPAGRSFFSNIQSSIFSFINSKQSLDPFIVEFGAFYEVLKKLYSDNDTEKTEYLRALIDGILNSNYLRENEKDYLVHNNERKVNLLNASSGQQESLPLLITIETLMQVQLPGVLYIEEPEAHLFPNAQKNIIQLLARVFNSKSDNYQIIITTHSPYILSSFNNLMYAGSLDEKLEKSKLKKLNKLIPSEERIDPKMVSAYSLDLGGKKRNLIDKETGLISQNYLDDVSNKISTEFGKLLDLEF